MMRLSYCSFALLVWLPVTLNARGTPELCSAPTLHNAFLVPKDSYQQHEKIKYACENGYKPAVEGWLAESVCRNSQWSPQPLCIRSACVMRQGQYTDFKLTKDELLMEGEIRSFNCGYPGYEKRARCINSEIFLTHCCPTSYVGSRDCDFVNRA